MIEVEKMNNQKIFLNPDLITTMEVTPDTVVTFSNGEKILTRTSPQQIIDRIIEFKRKIASGVVQK